MQKKKQISNRNLLDNGFFTINSRGLKLYTGIGYNVDRWRTYEDSCSINVNEGYITVKRQIAQCIKQYSYLYGKMLTLSIKTEDGIYSASSIFHEEDGNYCLYTISEGEWISLWKNGAHCSVQYNNTNDVSKKIYCMKLEIGEVSTLEMDIPLNYEEELYKCKYSTTDSSDDIFSNQRETDSLITTNMIKCILQTTTKNGVTITNNEDGTYTLNGTSTAYTVFTLTDDFSLNEGNYKIIGRENTTITAYNVVIDEAGLPTSPYTGYDGNSNGVFRITEKSNYACHFITGNNCTFNNLMIKPMLTRNLYATYNDFVPYTGNTGKLNNDVSNISKKASTISNPNLLINPDFKINQRGWSEYILDGTTNYSHRYFVDQWQLLLHPVLFNNGRVYQNSNGSITAEIINVETDDNYITIRKKFEDGFFNQFRGQLLTLSIKISDININNSTNIRSASKVNLAGYNNDEITVLINGWSLSKLGNGIHSITFEVPDKELTDVSLSIYLLDTRLGGCGNGSSITIDWVKMELGSVATQFVPPELSTELLKCQRYFLPLYAENTFYHITNGYNFGKINVTVVNIPIPVRMRVIPTIKMINPGYIAIAGEAVISGAGKKYGVDNITNNICRVWIVSNNSAEQPASWVDYEIELSAEL